MISACVSRVCVIVPARNEAGTIAAAVAALGNQTGVDLNAVEVIVLANNCDDDTAARARAAGRLSSVAVKVIEHQFREDDANIGTVRRTLMDLAASRLPSDGVIASTDADTVVAPDWLAATLAAVDAGADLVGGRIFARPQRDGAADPSLRRLYLADTVYRFLIAEVEDLIDPTPADPWPRHFQHFGASLAVTRDAYLRAGGLPKVPFLEDMALHDELRRRDAAIRHCPTVRAATSARLAGRVGMGLSTQLREWRELIASGRPSVIESAEFIIERARERRRLRELWTSERLWEMGETFGCFSEACIAGFDPPVARLEPLGDAIATLRRRLTSLRVDGRAPLLSDSLEQIEPVRLLAAAGQMSERSV